MLFDKLTRAEDGLDISLAKLIEYKFIFYSPHMIIGQSNIFKTKKTVINSDLYTEMYQSKPLPLGDSVSGLNYNVNNPLYIPYQPYSQSSYQSSNPSNSSSAMIIN